MDTRIEALGKELVNYKGKSIHENGLREKDKIILWDEIQAIFYEAKQHYEVIIPTHASMKISIYGTVGNQIDFNIGSLVTIGDRKKEEMIDIYGYIVSQIIERQRDELLRSLQNGESVKFGEFEISQHAISRKKLFGGYETIESNRIAGCSFDGGQFVIEYFDDKGRIKKKQSGYVNAIPNMHLARLHLLTLAEQNASQS